MTARTGCHGASPASRRPHAVAGGLRLALAAGSVLDTRTRRPRVAPLDACGLGERQRPPRTSHRASACSFAAVAAGVLGAGPPRAVRRVAEVPFRAGHDLTTRHQADHRVALDAALVDLLRPPFAEPLMFAAVEISDPAGIAGFRRTARARLDDACAAGVTRSGTHSAGTSFLVTGRADPAAVFRTRFSQRQIKTAGGSEWLGWTSATPPPGSPTRPGWPGRAGAGCRARLAGRRGAACRLAAWTAWRLAPCLGPVASACAAVVALTLSPRAQSSGCPCSANERRSASTANLARCSPRRYGRGEGRPFRSSTALASLPERREARYLV